MSHRFSVRVYYEDTDAAGIVYHSNYLNFAERARTEWLRELGFNQSQWLGEDGVGFVVHRIEVDFVAPARLDDALTIETHLHEMGKVRMTMQQIITCGSKELVRLVVKLACINRDGKPVAFPTALRDKML